MNWLTTAKLALALAAIGSFAVTFLVLKSHRKQVVLTAISFAISALIAEILLAVFAPQTMEHDMMFQPDAELGWTFLPSHTARIVYPGVVSHSVSTNAHGFRDGPPPNAKAGAKKIMVLGDSFVTNVAVAASDVVTEVLESELEHVAVLNFGVNGYSQVQELLLLRHWLGEIAPDLVLVMIYLRNDFIENTGGGWLHARPYADWEGDPPALVLRPVPADHVPPGRNPLTAMAARSHLYGLLNRALGAALTPWIETGELPSANAPPELYLCRSDTLETTLRTFETMTALVARIADYAQQASVPIAFVLAPSMLQVDEERWASMLRRYGRREEDYERSLPNDMLLGFAERNAILMLDLLPAMRAEAAKGERLYNPIEQHWNRLGNRVAAAAMLSFIREHSLLGYSAQSAELGSRDTRNLRIRFGEFSASSRPPRQPDSGPTTTTARDGEASVPSPSGVRAAP